MISEYTFSKQLIELKQLKEVVESIGFKAEVLERSVNLPIHLLSAELRDPNNESEVIQNLSCCFLPIDDSELKQIQLLQFYSGFPIIVKNEDFDSVNRLIGSINLKTSIGYFGVNPTGQIYQRYVYSKNQFTPIDELTIIEIIALFLHVQNTFIDFVFDLNAGLINLATALSKVEEI